MGTDLSRNFLQKICVEVSLETIEKNVRLCFKLFKQIILVNIGIHFAQMSLNVPNNHIMHIFFGKLII